MKKVCGKDGDLSFYISFCFEIHIIPVANVEKKNECTKEEYEIFDDLAEWKYGENAKNPHFEYPQHDLDSFEGFVRVRMSDTCLL